MDRMRALEVFVEIVERGTMSRAGAALGMSQTMVSTHLSELEARLGKRLLARSTRRMDLTEEGRRFLDHTRHILASVRAAEDAVRGHGGAPRGTVRIDAPPAIGHRFLLPAIPALHAAWPDILIDLSLGDRPAVLRPEGFDILVRVGSVRPEDADIRMLGRTPFVTVASPAYLARRGVPRSPDDIASHACIVYATVERPGGQRWDFVRDGIVRSLRPPTVARFNDGTAISGAAVAGLGIARTLEVLVADELADGRLVRLLEDWSVEPQMISAFAPLARSHIPAVAATLDYLETLPWTGASSASFVTSV